MKQNLTEGNVGKHLIDLTIPMIWGVFAVIAFSIADTYYVGKLGADELAAMSFTWPVVTTLGSLAMGLGVGASSIIARAIGEGDRLKVQRLTTDSLSLSLLAVGIFVFIGLATIDPLFTALGATPELLPLIHSYMEIWYWGMIFLVIPMVGNSAIRAAGNIQVASMIMIFAGLVNIILDPFFIFGWAGLPRLELAGAAMATVIARATTLLAALFFLYREKMLCYHLPKLPVLLNSWKNILYVGLPAAGSSMIMPMSIGVITSMVAVYGNEAVAGFGVASRVEAFGSIVLMSLAAIIGPFVGQNWGAKQYHRVHRSLQLSFLFCLFWGVFLAAIIAPTGSWIASLFNSDPKVVKIAATYLLIVPISYGASGAIQVASSTFNALGKPLPSTAMILIRMLVLYVPLAYLGRKFFGINGIFLATAFSNIAVGWLGFIWTQKTCADEKRQRAESMDGKQQLVNVSDQN
ncbi:MAG: MATE family efflux transporter [Gomphosphaeria aponina SAG 52.96 = DSM 107014]|uniref:MATE family efflux transporter n=1 Tax=Gomphosphaeria aponina SAG 52.96 = DSM 107014 TaxID=1521640 RepID=A0A941GSU6_9CHRO|nr:MATE family efflux transporter [Gomphosphaeria aponina SAG 52.96 = DSM 107014]